MNTDTRCLQQFTVVVPALAAARLGMPVPVFWIYVCASLIFLHPAYVPGIPLQKLTPEWIHGRMFLAYLLVWF